MPKRFTKKCPACRQPRTVRKNVWKASRRIEKAFLNCGCVIRKAMGMPS